MFRIEGIPFDPRTGQGYLMGFKAHVRRLLNAAIKRYGYEIILSSQVYDWQRANVWGPRYGKTALPEGAEDYLHEGNPRYRELREKYGSFDRRVTDSLIWTEGYVRPEDMKYFRGDNPYYWQLRGERMNLNILGYGLTTYYVKAQDRLGLLDKLQEDEHFGVFTFRIADKLISRELLDSIVELYFLERRLGISKWSNLRMLDIGAGYGRLAHRAVSAFDNIEYCLCTDAVPVSTFLCEYYLCFRKADRKAKVLALFEVEEALKERRVDIAVNVHSFSECRIPAIEWWIALLKENKVRYLMIVPNVIMPHTGEVLLTNEGKDFSGVIERQGYKLIAKEPKYADPIVQEYGLNPTHHYLFELQ